MSAHTPGQMQWRCRSDGSLIYIIGGQESGSHAQGDIHIGEADLKRITACWNACESIADPENVIPRLLALNDLVPKLESHAATLPALFAALVVARKTLATALQASAPDMFETNKDVADHLVIRQIDAAIAKATGTPA